MASGQEADNSGMEAIVKAITEEGYVYKDFTSVTDEEMEALYAHGFALLSSNQAQEAEGVFTLLCQLDHYQSRFWIGLGASRQGRREFEGAVKAYAMAGTVDVDNPVPAVRAAECYLVMNNLEAAESGIEAALHWAGADPAHEAVRQRAAVLQQALKRRRGGDTP